MKKCILPLALILLLSCTQKRTEPVANKLNILAEQYVRLGLAIGQYDGDFVDAYYGPDSLKPTGAKLAAFPKDSLLRSVARLDEEVQQLTTGQPDSILHRAKWLHEQLTAFDRRIRIFSGAYASFDEESKGLFGVTAPKFDEDYFRGLLAGIDSVLPGKGDLAQRFRLLSDRFIIPKNKLDTVFRLAIAEARKRTQAHYQLPGEENFTLEYVTGKPWSGYNWYKGNYTSLIQINTDLPITIERAIDLACHEGYPGHHVYNMLLEQNLYRGKGWVEISFYPLFSPQSLIAEGSANFGIEVAFPGADQESFIKNVLLPAAGMDSAGLGAYFAALGLRKQLNYARNEAARAFLANSMEEKAAVRWLKVYGLSTEETAVKSLSFIKKYRSYVINYNYGLDLVKAYIENKGGTPAAVQQRWQLFGDLLSNEISTSSLVVSKK